MCIFFPEHLFRFRNCIKSLVGISAPFPFSMLAFCLSGLTSCRSCTWCHSFCKFIYAGTMPFLEDYSLGVTLYFWLLWSFCVPESSGKGLIYIPFKTECLEISAHSAVWVSVLNPSTESDADWVKHCFCVQDCITRSHFIIARS